ncbi:hypothetical protein SELMODRAFT_405302 [Selaginella moellendorffii]|uniref:Uncharacterized protein n=1 Tax=Selaginella moellendorffii TaxID=88036 RepID=D8QWX4_SELML|nr:hypothetical protein SELMODRAFT_405302 [Selaginella moellendorffii]
MGRSIDLVQIIGALVSLVFFSRFDFSEGSKGGMAGLPSLDMSIFGAGECVYCPQFLCRLYLVVATAHAKMPWRVHIRGWKNRSETGTKLERKNEHPYFTDCQCRKSYCRTFAICFLEPEEQTLQDIVKSGGWSRSIGDKTTPFTVTLLV